MSRIVAFIGVVVLRRGSTSTRTSTPSLNLAMMVSAISWSSMNHMAMSMLTVSFLMYASSVARQS